MSWRRSRFQAMDASEPSRLGAGRLLLRFGVGLAGLTREGARSLLAAAREAVTAETGATPGDCPETTLGGRHATLGLLLELLDGGARAQALLRARLSRAARPARRLAAPMARVGRLVGRAPGAARAAAQLRGWRARGTLKLVGWAVAGRHEEAESRAFARAALATAYQAALVRVTDSPMLKRVIREQSEGIAVTAVTELRDRSARADSLAEGAVRRLFGRGQRGGS